MVILIMFPELPMILGKLSTLKLQFKETVVELSKKPMVENQEKDHNNVEL